MVVSLEKPRAVHHIAVMVTDLARAEAFYAGVLGLSVQRRLNDEAGVPRSVWVGLGDGGFLAIERARDSTPARPEGAPGWHCVALAITVGARQDWRRHLDQSGFVVFRESPYTLYVHDPDGNIVALSHYPDHGEKR